MAETRIEKYKKYRESLNEVKANVKESEFEEVRRSRTITDKVNTTSTLPLEEVLGQIDEEQEEHTTKIITLKRVKIGITIALGLALIAGIVIFAVIAFGGQGK